MSDEDNVDSTREIDPELGEEQMYKATKWHKVRPWRSSRLAGHQPQYSRFIGDAGILLQDICFLSSIDMQDGEIPPSHVTKYVNRSAYVSHDNTVENIHPYALFSKVQIHKSTNHTCKDIIRLPEEEN